MVLLECVCGSVCCGSVRVVVGGGCCGGGGVGGVVGGGGVGVGAGSPAAVLVLAVSPCESLCSV